MSAKLGSQSVLVRAKDQVCADLGGGQTALMSVEHGSYYSLNEVGGRVWELLSEPRPLAEVSRIVAQEYEVATEQAERDVSAYVEQLLDEGLLRLSDAAPAR